MREKRNFIWNPDLAYIVGLIVTDGCLSSNGRNIIFTSKDTDLIDTFKRILELKNKTGLTRNKRSCASRVQFSDVQLYRWLLTIGLTPRKSRTIGPVDIPDEFFRDFLRGHLDGDGSITVYTDKYNTFKNPKYVYERLTMRFISASKKHIEWLKEKVEANLHIKGRFHTSKPKPSTGNSMYILKFGKRDSIELLKKIYYAKDLPALERKRTLANRFIYPTRSLQNSVEFSIVRPCERSLSL